MQGSEERCLESEESGEMSALVVASQQMQHLGVQDLEREEVEHHLDTEHAPVHVVAWKEKNVFSNYAVLVGVRFMK